MIKTRTLSAAAAFVAGMVLLGGAVAPANAVIPEPAKAKPAPSITPGEDALPFDDGGIIL